MVAICLWQNTPFDGNMSVSKYQHHAAVWGCFATWIQMSLYMERLPRYGIYLLMLRKVARTFMKLAWSYTSLIFAFGCAFYLVFPSQYYFQNDLPSVFVKVFKMNQYCLISITKKFMSKYISLKLLKFQFILNVNLKFLDN